MNTITILAVIAILAGFTTVMAAAPTMVTPVTAQTDNATMAGNMTGANMTGGNTTDATGSISGVRGG